MIRNVWLPKIQHMDMYIDCCCAKGRKAIGARTKGGSWKSERLLVLDYWQLHGVPGVVVFRLDEF